MGTGICPFCGKKVDKFIMFRGDVVGCRYCGIQTKQTKADRIRSMSDEELARFIVKFEDLCYRHAGAILADDMEELVKDRIEWLREETK